MEFRIFAPVITAEELQRLQQEEDVAQMITGPESELINLLTALAASISALREETHSPFVGAVESRTDQYFPSGHLCGLKFRSGKKLEIKVQQKIVPSLHGFEHWRKSKLGKQHPSQYLREIRDALFDAGHATEEIDRVVEGGSNKFTELVSVQKARCKRDCDGLSLETCDILVSGVTSMTSSAESKRQIRRSSWFSLCLEDTPDAVEEYILTSEAMKPLRDVLVRMDEVLKSISVEDETKSVALQQLLIDRAMLPVLSGYPLWLHIATKIIVPEQSPISALEADTAVQYYTDTIERAMHHSIIRHSRFASSTTHPVH